MPWIELDKPRVMRGKKRSPGFRIDYPYQAALALVTCGAAYWVDGPHKESDPEREEKQPDPPENSDPDPEREREDETPDEPDPPDQGDDEHPDPDAFAKLDLGEQKELIREVGLDGECDLRKPLEMAIAYGAWYEDQ